MNNVFFKRSLLSAYFNVAVWSAAIITSFAFWLLLFGFIFTR